jgi:hypothetical protein
MVSVINGYVCFTSCDAAAARQSKDPASPPGSISGVSNNKTSSLDSRPATVLDGALKDVASKYITTKASAFAAQVAPQKVNLLT